jgi:hypothetical protein
MTDAVYLSANDKNKIIYRNAFATDYVLNGKNIKQIIEVGRTRWKIENENNNTSDDF